MAFLASVVALVSTEYVVLVPVPNDGTGLGKAGVCSAVVLMGSEILGPFMPRLFCAPAGLSPKRPVPGGI